MALILCPECQREVSTEALACPQCALPHPGRKEQENGHHTGVIRTCPDCKKTISKNAQMCPSCGAPTRMEEDPKELVASEPGGETWLCPHCSMPYTRRGKTRKTAGLDPMASIEATDLEGSGISSMVDEVPRLDGVKSHDQSLAMRRGRKKSPLWKEVSVSREMPIYQPRPKKRGGTIFLVFVMILLSAAAWTVWEFKDLNGLEALVYWRM